MRFKFLKLIVFGCILPTLMLVNCTKNDNPTPENPDNTPDEGEFTDARDGKTYDWVKIGNQIWMAENLAFQVDTGGLAYENIEDSVFIYGYLYNWWTANAVTPEGWHLPSDDEWNQLESYLIENGFSYDGVIGNKGIGKSLASENRWNNSDIPGAIGYPDSLESRNSTGFTSIPGGGLFASDSSFTGIGDIGRWWSNSEFGSTNALYRFMDYNFEGVYSEDENKSNGFSVRCIKD
jgi:uncharacterized protein (TIGR02145 family)